MLAENSKRVLTSLRRIIQAVHVYSRKLSFANNITGPQLHCLNTINENGPLTQKELGRQVSLGPSTVNGVVDRLEKKGWLSRERDTVDRRRTFLKITNSGHELLASAPSPLQDRLNEALSALPAMEQERIADCLEQVAQLMSSLENTTEEALPGDSAGPSDPQKAI
ncbi:MAG: MarR family winged helix-turn-helix transcriptional regulator [Candidatus Sumerlaeia bacterium]